MVKKPSHRTAASSAAAAAATDSTIPTFTSFATATAHALGNYNDSSTTDASVEYETSQWDSTALQLVRKISKKDSTTKLRAVTQLNEHLQTIDSNQNGVGKLFISAWGPAFRTVLLEETNPAVRAAVINLVPLITNKLGRLIQPIFLSLLQLWIGALGDESVLVSTTAKKSIDEALPTASRKEKVLSRYGAELGTYCVNETINMTEGNGSYSCTTAKRIIAILTWLLETASSIMYLEPFLDDDNNLFMGLAKGKKRKKKDEKETCITQCCQFAVSIVKVLQPENDVDVLRANKLADLALYGVKQGEDLSWDLIIVLLQGGWHSSFGDELKKMEQLICVTIRDGKLGSLHTLLPIFDALPGTKKSSIVFVEKILQVLKSVLYSKTGDSQDSEKKVVPMHFVLAASPAYLESIAFVLIKGINRWLNHVEPNERENVYDEIFSNHFRTAFEEYILCKVPPVLKSRYNNIMSGNGGKRKQGPTNHSTVIENMSRAFACVLRTLPDHKSASFYEKVFEGIRLCDVDDIAEMLHRLERIVLEMENKSSTRNLVLSVTREIGKLGTQHDCTSKLGFLSRVLGNKALISPENNNGDERTFVKDLANIIVLVFNNILLCNSPDMLSSIRYQMGEVLSYLSWVTSCLGEEGVTTSLFAELDRTLSNDQKWDLYNDLLIAHGKRRENEIFFEWAPITETIVQESIIKAYDDFSTGDKQPNCIQILTTYIDPSHHTKRESKLVEQINRTLAEKIQKATDKKLLDTLVEAFLHLILSEESCATFDEFLVTCLERVAHNSTMVSSLLSIVKKQKTDRATVLAADLITEIKRLLAVNKTNNIEREYAMIAAEIVKVIGEKDMQKSISLSKELVGKSYSLFSKTFLVQTPRSFIFGDGANTDIDIDFLLNYYAQDDRNIEPDLSDLQTKYLESLDKSSRDEIIMKATNQFLTTDSPGMLNILSTLFLPTSEEESCENVFTIVQDCTMHHLQVVSGNYKQVLIRMSKLLSFCMSTNKDSTESCFKPFFSELLKTIRRELPTEKTLLYVDILSATLPFRDNTDTSSTLTTEPPCSWLMEAVNNTLRSIRMVLQQSRGISKKEIHILESHGALLMWKAILSFPSSEINMDDIRFWCVRTTDALELFTTTTTKQQQSETKRICNFCKLSCALIDAAAPHLPIDENILDKLCHWGCWCAPNLFPCLETFQQIFSNSSAYSRTFNIASEYCALLILRAAERECLLFNDGSLPISADHIYHLTNYLASPCHTTRRATFTLLSYILAITLPETIASKFRPTIFESESSELRFVTDILPSSLCDALLWTSPPSDSNPESQIRSELAYLLVWRIFLELLRFDNAIQPNSTTSSIEEHLSLKRIGMTYLHANSSLFTTFLTKCTEIITQGTITEKQVTSIAAAQALASEQRPLQGIQLATSSSDPSTSQTISIDQDDLESLTGHATGFALARALQHLPALCRSHLTNHLSPSISQSLESFVRKQLSPFLISSEIDRVRISNTFITDSETGIVSATGSAIAREVYARYTFHDVTIEMVLKLPEAFPLKEVAVEARSKMGLSEARWRKILLGMIRVLKNKDGSIEEAVALWKKNLDQLFAGAEECPICYSVLHLSTAALPRMSCRTCGNRFHRDCIFKWFKKSNGSACPMCRSAF